MTSQFVWSGELGEQARYRQVRPTKAVADKIGATVCKLLLKPVELFFEFRTTLLRRTRNNVKGAHHHAPRHRPHHVTGKSPPSGRTMEQCRLNHMSVCRQQFGECQAADMNANNIACAIL